MTATASPTLLDRALVVDMWRQVQALHRDRIAHRNLDLESMWVTPDGRAVLRGFDGAAIAATDRDLALDRAQLLVSTALVIGAPAAVDGGGRRAGRTRPLTSAVPYLQPLALPAPTRRAWRGNKEVLDALRAAIARATGVEPAPLARLDRIRPRTAVSLAAFVAAFYFLLPQLGDFGETAEAASRANWWWLGPMLMGAAATIAFAALAFVASVPEPIPYLPAPAHADRVVVRQPHRAGQHRHAGGGRALPAALGPRPGPGGRGGGPVRAGGLRGPPVAHGRVPAVGGLERRRVLAARRRRRSSS